MSLYKTYKSEEEEFEDEFIDFWDSKKKSLGLGNYSSDVTKWWIDKRKQEYISIIKGEILRLRNEKMATHNEKYGENMCTSCGYNQAIDNQISHLQSELKAIEEDK